MGLRVAGCGLRVACRNGKRETGNRYSGQQEGAGGASKAMRGVRKRRAPAVRKQLNFSCSPPCLVFACYPWQLTGANGRRNCKISNRLAAPAICKQKRTVSCWKLVYRIPQYRGNCVEYNPPTPGRPCVQGRPSAGRHWKSRTFHGEASIRCGINSMNITLVKVRIRTNRDMKAYPAPASVT
jgi:hypothetical protein